ncbi:MAG: NUDIX hydrolase [Hyphomicrobiaceae bacterium]
MTSRLRRPLWPRPGASAAVFRDGAVLLVERGKGPRGVWSLPGGHIEPGETARAAALREVAEETGVVCDLLGIANVHDVLLRDAAGELTAHYVLAVFYGRWRSGEPQAQSDCCDARFVSLDALGSYVLTEGAQAVIVRAAALFGSA